MPKRFLFVAVLTSLPLITVSTTMSGDAGGEEALVARSSYAIRSAVLGVAGSRGASPGYVGNGTLGQSTPIGIGSAAGWTLYAGFWKAFLMVPVGVEEMESEAVRDCLFSCSPNPFHEHTRFEYTIARAGPVEVRVFDVRGRVIRTLTDQVHSAGKHQLAWDGRTDRGTLVSSGLYFYRLDAGSFSSVKRMLVLR
jgi:hypothetical protein